MGIDPATIGLLATLGGTAYSMTQKRRPPPGPGPPPVMQEGEPLSKKKPKKYRPPAQIFGDKDLRLGAAGQLGRTG
ncbi:MAG: hypothetical protein ACYTEQ_30290 [Planctomycetota bacterium]|jgi:hypothetical protein